MLAQQGGREGLSPPPHPPTHAHTCSWRKLEGSDPAAYELLLKVQALQRRLIAKTEEVRAWGGGAAWAGAQLFPNGETHYSTPPHVTRAPGGGKGPADCGKGAACASAGLTLGLHCHLSSRPAAALLWPPPRRLSERRSPPKNEPPPKKKPPPPHTLLQERLYLELKAVLARQPGPGAAEQLVLYQASLREKGKQMRALAGELNAQQAQVWGRVAGLAGLAGVEVGTGGAGVGVGAFPLHAHDHAPAFHKKTNQVAEYKYEIERLQRELADMKRAYFEQKRAAAAAAAAPADRAAGSAAGRNSTGSRSRGGSRAATPPGASGSSGSGDGAATTQAVQQQWQLSPAAKAAEGGMSAVAKSPGGRSVISLSVTAC